MRRLSTHCLFAFSVLSLFLIVGCGDPGPKLVPVEGNVSVAGEPLKKGSIMLHPDAGKGNQHTFAQPPVGSVTAGKYSISTGAKSGAPAGWYKVTINASVPSDPKDEYSAPKLLVDESYTDPAKTNLTLEVKEGAPAGSYDLKLTK